MGKLRLQTVCMFHREEQQSGRIVQLHECLGVVVYLHPVIIQPEAHGGFQAIGQLDVRLVEEAQIQLRRMELLGNIQRRNFPYGKH